MAVKFPLEMKDGVQVRNIEELRANFDIEKVVGYFLNGKLKKWLDARWYEDESEAISKLDEKDVLLTERLCEIFSVEYAGKEINTDEIAARNARISKIKQYTDNEEIINNISAVAFNQEELANLYEKQCEKIILCEGTFKIPKAKQNLKYEIVGDVNVEGLREYETEDNSTGEIEKDVCFFGMIPEELADLIVRKIYIELKDYLVWTERGRISETEEKIYREYFSNKKTYDMSKRFKVWNKKKNEYFSFDIFSITLPTYIDELGSFENKILIKGISNRRAIYDLETGNVEKYYSGVAVEGRCLVCDPKYAQYHGDGYYIIHNFYTNEIENVNCKSGGWNYLYANNKIFYFNDRKIYIYNLETQENKILYNFGEKDVANLFQMVFFNDELFVLYDVYGNSKKTLLGVKMDGSAEEYYQIHDASTCHMLYDRKLCSRSQYLIFEHSRNIYVFDMRLKEMKEYKECTTITCSFVVGNYLYIHPLLDSKRYRVDLTKKWNPIDLGYDYII